VEYLEDAFPDPPLRPHGAEARARVRLIARVAELYVMGALQPMFAQMSPATRDPALLDAQFNKLNEGLAYLETFLEAPYAAGHRFTTADCEVTPVLFFVDALGHGLGRPNLLAEHAAASAYFAHAKTDPVLAKVLGEMAEGLKAFGR
jgi:glutathione S-transferase